MKVVTQIINVKSKGENDVINITQEISDVILNSKTQNGNITVFVSGSTASITTIEYEPGLVKDFPNMLERIVPKNIDYGHEQIWHDENGHSHVRLL